jgi:hypothetical protein
MGSNTGEITMKKLLIAVTFVAFASSPVFSRTLACTGENFAKMTDRMATMSYGPKRIAMMREMAAVNTGLSTGDLRGACRHYVVALAVQNDERDPFQNLHEE